MNPTSQVDVLVVGGGTIDPEVILDAIHEQTDGVHIAIVGDGAAAIEFLTICTAAPNLILLDLHLPDMGALEFLRQVRSTPLTSATTVIIMTGTTSSTDRHKAYLLGANGFITTWWLPLKSST